MKFFLVCFIDLHAYDSKNLFRTYLDEKWFLAK